MCKCLSSGRNERNLEQSVKASHTGAIHFTPRPSLPCPTLHPPLKEGAKPRKTRRPERKQAGARAGAVICHTENEEFSSASGIRPLSPLPGPVHACVRLCKSCLGKLSRLSSCGNRAHCTRATLGPPARRRGWRPWERRGKMRGPNWLLQGMGDSQL
jgi:hypothetical protein